MWTRDELGVLWFGVLLLLFRFFNTIGSRVENIRSDKGIGTVTRQCLDSSGRHGNEAQDNVQVSLTTDQECLGYPVMN